MGMTLTIKAHGRLSAILFTLLLPLLVYTTITELVVDDDSTGKSGPMPSESKSIQEGPSSLDDLNDRHVLLSPPTELRPYFINTTSAVFTWSVPSVYITHDVHNASMTMRNVPGPYVLKKVFSSGNDSCTDSNQIDRNMTGFNNRTSSPESPSERQCHTMIFFANYTVALESVGDKHNETYKTVSFQSTPESHKRLTVVADGETNILVPFDQGCLTHYEYTWTEKILGGVAETGSVSADLDVFTISKLKPDTKYEVSIKAYYISGDAVTLTIPVLFSTLQVNQTSNCLCNWQGGQTKICIKVEENERACYCKEGYAGRFCEHCAAGFYRTAPYHPCHRCPCPVYAAKRPMCKFDEGFLECGECQVGYTGNICHRCANGFYMKRSACVPCFCNGNSPQDSVNMCKPTNGECYDCQYNTTGLRCQSCLPGYIGDPFTYKNCTLDPLASAAVGRKSHVSQGTIGMAVIVVGLLLVLSLVGLVYFKRYKERKARHQFWTVEMKRDQEDVDFNSVANDDAHINHVDDLKFYEPEQGGRPNVNKYARLSEQV